MHLQITHLQYGIFLGYLWQLMISSEQWQWGPGLLFMNYWLVAHLRAVLLMYHHQLPSPVSLLESHIATKLQKTKLNKYCKCNKYTKWKKYSKYFTWSLWSCVFFKYWDEGTWVPLQAEVCLWFYLKQQKNFTAPNIIQHAKHYQTFQKSELSE